MHDATQAMDNPIQADINNCWSSIGVRGDGSCPELQEHTRCLNCPTYSAAATAILDRFESGNELISEWNPVDQESVQQQLSQSALIFRVGSEWLAMPTGAIIEVAEKNCIRSLPHQNNRAILGLTNIRGALVLCVSLARMLNTKAADEVRGTSRLLVTTHLGQKLVFPVDEVFGIYRFSDAALESAPTTLAHSGTSYTQAILNWDRKKVGMLDCDLLFYALNRSLV
ncbi:chemotaxis protein CheW [Herminiimonas sp. NPDC097707]|uniref:chemotaxis protein CheW n=1 Tax=Herminiimonas sp. NPDC097707 TaxID=3364007 RepID=UPI00383B80F3